jgi:hypothetical protein
LAHDSRRTGPRTLLTYYLLFFIHLESRQVDTAGITVHQNEPWMKQIARNGLTVDFGMIPGPRRPAMPTTV